MKINADLRDSNLTIRERWNYSIGIKRLNHIFLNYLFLSFSQPKKKMKSVLFFLLDITSWVLLVSHGSNIRVMKTNLTLECFRWNEELSFAGRFVHPWWQFWLGKWKSLWWISPGFLQWRGGGHYQLQTGGSW